MGIAGVTLDGTRHIDSSDWTRCGLLIPHGTEWSWDPDEGQPDGKLCKTCYATIEVEQDYKAEVEAAKAEEAEPSQTLAQPEVAKPAKTATKRK